MSVPFECYPLHPKSFMQRLLKQEPIDNAIIEVNNLLAAKDILSIGEEDLTKIEEKYTVTLRELFSLNLLEFYAVYYNYFLTNNTFSQAERNRVLRLQHLLGLNDDTVQQLHMKLGLPFFQKELKAALEAGGMDSGERLRLSEMPEKIGIRSAETDKAEQDIKQEFIHKYIQESKRSTRWSPGDEKQLDQLCMLLDVKMTDSDRQMIGKYRNYWNWENLPLEEISVPTSLQKSEICYAAFSGVNWYEERAVHRRDDSVYLFDTRLKKYLLSVPFEEPSSRHIPLLKYIDYGDIYLTNKRIIFSGIDKEASFKWLSVDGFVLFDQAVELRKETGKNPFFFLSDSERFFVSGKRLLQILTDPATP